MNNSHFMAVFTGNGINEGSVLWAYKHSHFRPMKIVMADRYIKNAVLHKTIRIQIYTYIVI